MQIASGNGLERLLNLHFRQDSHRVSITANKWLEGYHHLYLTPTVYTQNTLNGNQSLVRSGASDEVGTTALDPAAALRLVKDIPRTEAVLIVPSPNVLGYTTYKFEHFAQWRVSAPMRVNADPDLNLEGRHSRM